MNGLVAQIAGGVPSRCHRKDCRKKACAILLNGIPKNRVVVDLDCSSFNIPANMKRCDCLLVYEEKRAAIGVVLIELKSGRFQASQAVKQLCGGAIVADNLLPSGTSFEFVPVLAHGRGVHKNQLLKLRALKIRLRNQTKRTALLRCGQELKMVLP